jgi:hypothetical protein
MQLRIILHCIWWLCPFHHLWFGTAPQPLSFATLTLLKPMIWLLVVGTPQHTRIYLGALWKCTHSQCLWGFAP